MPDRVVQRSKIAEILAIVAVFVSLTTSLSVWKVNDRGLDRINDSRAEVTYTSCLGQNQRNKNTVKALDKQIEKAKKTASPEQLARLKASRDFTVLLINALVPVQDCEQIVKDRFGFVPKLDSKDK